MENMTDSFTDLSSDHSECQRLRYVSSSTFGKDWNGVLHAHDCTELFYVTDGEGWLCTADQSPSSKKPSCYCKSQSSPHRTLLYCK